MAELSPMMQQYFSIKEQYPDAILFFRLGDFYEMFFDDAKKASSVLELVLTGRDCGQQERAPMCGVPFHSCEGYIAKLVRSGYKVAVCEQVENPSKAKGLVMREVVRVVTPGTVTQSSMLEEDCNNFLACIYKDSVTTGVCFTDVSTGEMHITEVVNDDNNLNIINEIGRFNPKEVLVNKVVASSKSISNFLSEKINTTVEIINDEDFLYNMCENVTKLHFGVSTTSQLGFENSEALVCAIGCTLVYLKKTQKTSLSNINKIDYYSDSQFMKLDVCARKNLELLASLKNNDKRGSLLWVLDKTVTAMGKRLIRKWIEQPLINCAKITKRLNAVSELYDNSIFCEDIIESLSGIYDLERLMTRIIYGTGTPRELRSLHTTIKNLPKIKTVLANTKSKLLQEIYDEIDLLEDVGELIENSIMEEAPISFRDGGIIQAGYNEEIDTLREIMNNGKSFITSIEEREQEKTGIKKLKVGYNRVFGYFIEVTNSNKDLVPEEYIRKQTLSNCERYITQELKELEGKILGAKERVIQLEYDVFVDIRTQVAQNLHRIQQTAQAIGNIDVLVSFANVALKNNFVQPDIAPKPVIDIKQGRHPVVEMMAKDKLFVPNDTYIDDNQNRVAVITGPNMAGKSTYMRQVALITIMAQIGSFVPASYAKIGVVDAIFTRIGASDDLASGQSTFMVEMTEVSTILKNATSKSLLILDEIGRGTSTFDGMSIARAVLEYVVDKKKLGAKTLFSTHYHELTELENEIDGIKNYNISVKKRGDDITFLRRIVRGGADDSFGVDVAKLAGIPDSVVKRARVILKDLESNKELFKKSSSEDEIEDELLQVSFEDNKKLDLIDRLKEIDVETLTPLESINILYDLIKQAKN